MQTHTGTHSHTFSNCKSLSLSICASNTSKKKKRGQTFEFGCRIDTNTFLHAMNAIKSETCALQDNWIDCLKIGWSEIGPPNVNKGQRMANSCEIKNKWKWDRLNVCNRQDIFALNVCNDKKWEADMLTATMPTCWCWVQHNVHYVHYLILSR